MAFSHIDTWVFDLDNTLYPSQSEILERVHDRINAFIMAHFGIPLEAAEQKRKGFYQKYGTTLAGMMAEHTINPDDYLSTVHQIDISSIPRCPVTARGLERLPGRRIVFTNSAREHAKRVLEHMDIGHLFENIFDIRSANYVSKPAAAPYHQFIDAFDIDPKRACMIEDTAKNLIPAAALGMTTVWISDGKPLPDGVPETAIAHRFDTLAQWMKTHD